MKNIVITGASQGIGAETAKAFAKEKDVNVILLARSEKNLQTVTAECKKLGADAHYFVCDVTNDQQVSATGKKILDQWGAPTVLVNNAGGYEENDLSHTTIEGFRNQFEVNVTSAFMVTKVFYDAMVAKKSGDIFYVCSIVSIMAHPGSIAYTTAKHGLLGLARAVRSESKNKGIRVTAIMPGETLTPPWGENQPEEKFIPAEDIGNIIVDVHGLDKRTDVEEIIVRPQQSSIVQFT